MRCSLKLFGAFFVGFVFLGIAYAWGLSAPSNAFPVEKGTKIVYDVSFGALLKGKSTMLYHGMVQLGASRVHSITYTTRFTGGIYSSTAKVYVGEDLFPIRIETEITRSGRKSKGLQEFFPERKMAIFTQVIDNNTKMDTLLREFPLQDITTLPFYLMSRSLKPSDTLEISLPQGEYRFVSEGEEIVELRESDNVRATVIESVPPDIKIWMDSNNRIPIKIHLRNSKILMIWEKTEKNK
jgi:hypothetical protein